MDDVPITLCTTEEKAPISAAHQGCLVRCDIRNARLFYAGISPEGFDFSTDVSKATQLDGDLAKRVATAIANVQLNWAHGKMYGGRIVVLNDKNEEQFAIH